MSSASKLKNVKWRKITAPGTWYPKPDEELVGFYLGRTKRDGSFGPYEVLMVAVPYKGAFMVSGTQVIQLADAAMLARGDAVRIRFCGYKEILSAETGEVKKMKLFEMYVGEVQAADDLPAEVAQG